MSVKPEDVSMIRGMLNRGDKMQDIAAFFGINQARIHEVKDGKYGNYSPAPMGELPPKGPPGRKGHELNKAAIKAIKALERGDSAEGERILKSGVTKYEKPSS